MLKIDRMLQPLRLHAAARPMTTFRALSELPDDACIPLVDRQHVDDCQLTPLQRQWRKDGALCLRRFVPDTLLRTYRDMQSERAGLAGWHCKVPYMHLPEARALCLYRPLTEVLEELVGEPVAVQRNDTEWRSRWHYWHQGDYMQPRFATSWQLSAWVALGPIDADCGPFEFVPGSHRWPVLRGDKVRALLSRREAGRVDWPEAAGRLVHKIYEDEMYRQGATTTSFLAEPGDVLIWHGRLIGRDAPPRHLQYARYGFAAHYAAISRRRDMPRVGWTASGSAFFVIDDQPLDPPRDNEGGTFWSVSTGAGLSATL